MPESELVRELRKELYCDHRKDCGWEENRDTNPEDLLARVAAAEAVAETEVATDDWKNAMAKKLPYSGPDVIDLVMARGVALREYRRLKEESND